MNFPATFAALTGYLPFPWQEALFSELASGSIRSKCDVPTGLGKTSTIAVWLCALGATLSDPKTSGRLPRRLVYVVDRRVVVDQATAEVERFRNALLEAPPAVGSNIIAELRSSLREASVVPDPAGVSISTLRGQFADNHAWHLDPARPAITVGTVDMIGSRLLFSGYGGLGRNWRSLQAGLLLQDAWIVLDEAHLAPAFRKLLEGVDKQRKVIANFPPFGVTCMSATLPTSAEIANDGEAEKSIQLFTATDENDSRVKKRYRALKTLRFVIDETVLNAKKGVAQAEALARVMSARAKSLAGRSRAVVIFANTVDAVEKIEAALKASLSKDQHHRVLALTGEMRGDERHHIENHHVIKAFAPDRERGSSELPAFLIATACIEVGMDLDADAAVCDAVALERMIQRLGRVNRRGETESEIHVVMTADPTKLDMATVDEFSIAMASSRALTQLPSSSSGYDASPAALRALKLDSKLGARAFTPASVAPPLDSARLDDWSLTSLKPERFPKPQVRYWLRGVMTDESVATSFVWRAELALAHNEEEATAMINAIAVTPREIAQVDIGRGSKLLEAIGKKHPSLYCVVRSLSGEIVHQQLGDYADKNKQSASVAFATVFLPVKAGGLRAGLVDWSEEALKSAVQDVVNSSGDLLVQAKEGVTLERWERVLLTKHGREILCHQITNTGDFINSKSYPNRSKALTALARGFSGGAMNLIARCEATIGSVETSDDQIAEDESDEAELAFFDDRSERRRRHAPQEIAYFHVTTDPRITQNENARSLTTKDIKLTEHTEKAEAVARALTAHFAIPSDIAEAIILAVRWHDRGKDRRCWQEAIGNRGGKPLAKSEQPYFDTHRNGGYRHEFGSLVEARDDEAIGRHPQRELILHLIAAHHGHARPSFSPNAFDPETPTPDCEEIAAEVPLRFARLQILYGWWSLAWLESLVKAADAIASKHPEWPTL